MGRHDAPDDLSGQVPKEVTLHRVSRTLDTLSIDHKIGRDRIVVPFPNRLSTIWLNHAKPRRLVADTRLRIPVDFGAGIGLGTFINTWNHDHFGGTASYRLEDFGDYAVWMRSVEVVRCGMTDTQLAAVLSGYMDYAEYFAIQAQERFHDVSFDVPLAPALLRELDDQALHARHPRYRHIPRGFLRKPPPENDDMPIPEAAECAPIELADIARVLEGLDFAYDVASGEIITTGVNGIAFALCIDGETHARIVAQWDTGRPAEGNLIPLAALCNDINQSHTGPSAYVYEYGERNSASDLCSVKICVEAACRIAEGLTADQLNQFIVAGLIALLSVIDRVSVQLDGRTAVEWPS